MSSPALKPAMDSLSVGPRGQKSPAGCLWAQCLLQVEPTLCHLLTTKEDNSELLPIYTYQRQPAFFLEPFQAAPASPAHHGSISLEIMGFGTVHAADF